MGDILRLVLGGIVGFLGVVFLSIKSDILPAILPSLEMIPITCYIKMIVALTVLVVLLVVLIAWLFLRIHAKVPISGKGKFCGISYDYRLNSEQYYKTRDVTVYLSWLCPRHGTVLQKNYETVKGDSVQTLYCNECKRYYPIVMRGSRMTPDEACDRISNTKIFPKISLAASDK